MNQRENKEGEETERGSEKLREQEKKRVEESQTKILILAAYLEGLAVFSLVLQLEVVVQDHYGDTA